MLDNGITAKNMVKGHSIGKTGHFMKGFGKMILQIKKED